MTDDARDESFGVTFVPIPGPRLASTPVVKILHDTCNGALAHARGGVERYRQRLRRGSFEGMECVIDVHEDGSKKGAAVLMTFLVKGRGYSLMAAGTRVEPDSERVRRFCDSFVVTDEPAFTGPIRRIGTQRLKNPPTDSKPPGNEIQFLTRLAPMTSAVFAPGHKALLTVNEAGTLLQYTYPEFGLVGKYRLASGAHRSVWDETRNRLYVATYKKPPPAIHPLELKRQNGVGDIHCYDLKQVLSNPRQDDAPLQPAATVEIGGNISHLLLAPDGKSLYYLDVKDPVKPRLAVIDTAKAKKTQKIPIADNTDVICLAPKGDRLYAAASLCGHKYAHPHGTKVEGLIQVIDPVSGQTRQSFKVNEDPFDMAVTADQCLVLTAGSNQHRSLTFIDLKDEGGPIIEQVGSLYMNTYVQLSASGRRLYLADTALSPATAQAWDMEAVTQFQSRSCGTARGTQEQPAGGDFYLCPSGYSLVCRTGAVYWITKAPLPHVAKGK
jgi:DNA-binding beta-propeller fold protein YncE